MRYKLSRKTKNHMCIVIKNQVPIKRRWCYRHCPTEAEYLHGISQTWFIHTKDCHKIHRHIPGSYMTGIPVIMFLWL